MSQTSSFVKKLASNDRPTRDAALEALQRYLSSKSSKKLSLLDMEKLWKGLYFSMWFCDRPKTQERLAENLGKLYSEVILKDEFSRFVESFWSIIILEWPSIDQWRIDKFYLLIRRVLRHNFKFLRAQNWDEKLLEQWLDVMNRTVLSGDKSIPVALPYHLCDIYLEELELVIFDDLKDVQEELDELNKEDKDYIEKYQEVYKKKLEVAGEIPIKELISPFERLNKEALLKTLREKCKEEVLDDARLKDWGVYEDEEDSADEKEGDANDDDSEEEWTGF
ncbi:putative ribosome biogenesis protein [Scheffersomyces xylosifermentans]|uniref:putative ribosome biogenesis protein n=1 Tax=Scheffersomyces xylosifermentans TaxID=1304137 RepID=UPI00315DDA8B